MPLPFSDREVLDMFVQSVEELAGSRYVEQIRQGGLSASYSFSAESGLVAERTGPDRDAAKAAILTLRFFCQNNEPTSVREMANRIDGLGIDPGLKQRFREARDTLNAFLDAAPTGHAFPTGTGADTNRSIFNTFMYGLFAHANPDRRRTVDSWRGQPYFISLELQFDVILVNFVKLLMVMAQVCREITGTGSVS